MVDEDSDEVVDVVLLWYRDDDGDLVDVLVDAIAPLADDGFIWLLTPKRGRDGYVEPSDIAEAAPTAGLSQTSIVDGRHRTGPAARLVAPKSRPGQALRTPCRIDQSAPSRRTSPCGPEQRGGHALGVPRRARPS